MFRELDRERADAAGARLDEDLLPGFRFAISTSACQAVRPTSGMEAASSMVSSLGLIATSPSFMAMNSAKVPIRSLSGRA